MFYCSFERCENSLLVHLRIEGERIDQAEEERIFCPVTCFDGQIFAVSENKLILKRSMRFNC
jgi:hypothetical protein